MTTRTAAAPASPTGLSLFSLLIVAGCGAAADDADRAARGKALFDAMLAEQDGLGPVFVRHSCAACHEDGARGPGAVLKMVLVDPGDGTPLPDQSALPYGHTVRPQLAAGALEPVTAPVDRDVLVTVRFGPALYGRGLIEAIADDEIERVQAEQSRAGSEISGRINRVAYGSEPNPDTRFHRHERGRAGLIGRFGLKARIASIDEFVADAFQNDMGITSPLRPQELPHPSDVDDALPGVDIDADTLNLVADYVRLLRIPTRGAAARSTRASALLGALGCADCHVPSLRTRADHPIEALAGVDAPVYSDLLLHDMGPEFADGLVEFDAGSSEWRTAPLIGLRTLPSYLHDGRAASIEEAVLMHGSEGSEAKPAVDRFRALDGARRAELLEFLSAL